jgi:sensor histidine kinase YesM
VSARLKLSYGEKCRFDVESTPGEGTTIRIHIPTEFI